MGSIYEWSWKKEEVWYHLKLLQCVVYPFLKKSLDMRILMVYCEILSTRISLFNKIGWPASRWGLEMSWLQRTFKLPPGENGYFGAWTL